MRQVLSTALVAVIVGALAGVTASTLAQPPAESERVITQSGFNADKVDGKHAVRATKMLRPRAKKLVATDKTGFLPDNIVKPLWHLIQNKPAVLTDNQVHWDEIVGKPPGFADGVDHADTTRSYIAATSPTYLAGQNGYLSISYPVTLDVEVSLIPAGGGYWATRDTNPANDRGEEIFLRTGNTIVHYFYFRNYTGAPDRLHARVTVFNDGNLAPAAVKKRVKASFHKGSKVPRP